MSGTTTVLSGSVSFNFIPANVNFVFDYGHNDTLEGGAGSATYDLRGNTMFLGTGGFDSSTIIAEGNDTIAAGYGATTVIGGSDPLSFFGGTGPSSLFLGSGNATLQGGPGAMTVAGGSGAITFDDKVGSGPDLFLTGTGHAHVTIGGGAATVIGGTGQSTITAGTGHDIFEFLAGNGGGKETIVGFDPTKDTIAPSSGYTKPPVETLTPGGDVITLTDGTQITHITLSGVDQKVL
jgi:Ca2+-binding RTX toxin-like protein